MRTFDVDEDEIAVLVDLERVDEHLRGFLVRIVVGEGLEIVDANAVRGSGANRADVEIVLDPPHKRFGERRAAPRHVVEVTPPLGVVARVKLVAYLVRAEDIDVGRQRVVDAAAQHLGSGVGLHIEVRDLRHRVHARIRPTGPVELEFIDAGRLADGAFDFAVYGARVLLNLPPAIAGARVFDGELESHVRHYLFTPYGRAAWRDGHTSTVRR